MTEEEILIISKIGPEDPEKLLMPFIVANASLALDIPVTVFLMASAVELAVKGTAEKIEPMDQMPVITDMLKTFFSQGGEMKLCGPCCNHRNITPDQLIEHAEIGGAAGLVDMVMNKKVVTF